MRKLLLGLPAFLPAAVGLWLEQRHAARVSAAVANGLASGWQRLRIAAFGFDEAVHHVVVGFGVSAALLFVLGLVVLARWLRVGAGAGRAVGLILLSACVTAAASLATLSWHAALLGRAFCAVSQERSGPLQSADLLVTALASAATARWLCLLFGGALLGSLVLAMLRRARCAVGPFAGAAWATLSLALAVGALHAAEAHVVAKRRATLEALGSSYYPREVQLVSAPGADFARRGPESVLWVGPQHLHFAEFGQAPREIAPASLLLMPYCVERLRSALAEFEAQLQHSAVALDASTAHAGLLCVIRALHRPESRALTWLVRADERLLEPPFDVTGIEYGAVSFAVQAQGRPGQTMLRPGASAQDLLRAAAAARAPVLLVANEDPNFGVAVDDGLTPPVVATEPSPLDRAAAPSAAPSGSGSARPPKLKLTFGVPGIAGPLAAKLLQVEVKKLQPRLQGCYAVQAVGNPYLEGRVVARFIVNRDGTVDNVSNGGSDLPDSRVIGCVLRTFYELKFPASPEGIVTVTYPLLFQPSDT